MDDDIDLSTPDKVPDWARREASLAATHGSALSFNSLRSANIKRQLEWCPDQTPDMSFRGNELAGETGEACNIIKKLERERHGWRGTRATREQLAEELADVVIVADLIANEAGIDLGESVRSKFNSTSLKYGLTVQIAPNDQAQALRPEH